MIQTKTIDSIVKEILIHLGLTIHWYPKFLLYALEDYEDTARRHGIGMKQLEITMGGSGGTQASATYDEVTYTSTRSDDEGNSVTLTFDGINNITTVVNAWNAANTTNTITHDGTGTDVPLAGTVTLSGGVNPRRAELPVDVQYIVDLGMQEGERILPMVRDKALNKKFNTNSDDERIAYPSANYGLLSGVYDADTGDDSTRAIDHALNNYGGIYGLSVDSDYKWDIDMINGEIVFSNNCPTANTYVLTYVPTVVSSSVANVVPRPVDLRIKEYILLRRLESIGAPDVAVRRQRQNYINAKNKVARNQNPLRYVDIINKINRIHAAPK